MSTFTHKKIGTDISYDVERIMGSEFYNYINAPPEYPYALTLALDSVGSYPVSRKCKLSLELVHRKSMIVSQSLDEYTAYSKLSEFEWVYSLLVSNWHWDVINRDGMYRDELASSFPKFSLTFNKHIVFKSKNDPLVVFQEIVDLIKI